MQWYLSYEGNQEGPLTEAQAKSRAQADPNGLCWREGFAEWIPIRNAYELSSKPARSAAPPPPSSHGTDEIDFSVHGESTQFVEIELDPGESAVAEAGAMMYKDRAIEMESVFGDGRANESPGLMDRLVGAGKRLVTGESLFTTVFTHRGATGKAHVAFAAPHPGTIIPMTLSNFGGRIICQKDAFLCAARGVSIGVHFQKKILTGLFGGEGFIMQKLEGDGQVFLHAGGMVVERELDAATTLHVDTGCLVALSETVSYDLEQVAGVKSMLFGGEGIFLVALRGPGKVWLQSLPFSRMAGRMLAAAPQQGGSRGEGSLLGGIGNLLDGDNRF